MHIFLRMALALTPSNAVVEQAFSRLTHLLSPLRLRLDPSLVQQYLIVALDAPGWWEYDFGPLFQRAKVHASRTPFRYPRSDKGGKHKRRRAASAGQGKMRPLTLQASQSSPPLSGQKNSSSDSDTSVSSLTSAYSDSDLE